jgi:hypothetical protein
MQLGNAGYARALKTALATCKPADDSSWPILLKKSALISTVEKYASEIEILTLCRGVWAQISRSSVQKRRFPRSIFE